jgi:autophagy-related protein 17
MSSSSAQGNDDSQASLSPEPSQNQLDVNDVPIETLVEHLLAAKRSLNSVGTVWKAEELVRSARSALEESVILSARTGFLWNGISEELKLLHKIRGGIHTVFNDGQKDFQVCSSSRRLLLC